MQSEEFWTQQEELNAIHISYSYTSLSQSQWGFLYFILAGLDVYV